MAMEVYDDVLFSLKIGAQFNPFLQLPEQKFLLVRGDAGLFENATSKEERQAVLDQYKVEYWNESAGVPDFPVDCIGSTVENLCQYLENDPNILKVVFGAPPEATAGSYLVRVLSRRLICCYKSNANVQRTVLRLETLNVATILDFEEGDQEALCFPEGTTFVAGFRNMPEPRLQDLHLLEQTIQQLNPSKLGLDLHGNCNVRFLEIVMEGAAKNPYLFLLSVEGFDTVRAGFLANVLNRTPSLQSLGFNHGGFDASVARVLVQNTHEGCAPRMVSFCGNEFHVDHENEEKNNLPLLTELILTKWTCLTCLDVSCNSFTYPAFGILCDALQEHKLIKKFVAKNCSLDGGPIGDFTSSLGNLFRNDKSLETIQLDETYLYVCDATVWENLCHNKTLKNLSLQQCFPNPRSWLDLYEAFLYVKHLHLDWRLTKKAVYLDVHYNDCGGIIHLSKPCEPQLCSEYNWMFATVRETYTVTHSLTVLPDACTHSKLMDLLPCVIACPKVKHLQLQTSTKRQALTNLNKIIPKANPSLESLAVDWNDEGQEYELKELERLQTKVEANLRKNRSLKSIYIPRLHSSQAMTSVPLRNKVLSVTQSIHTPISLLPALVSAWPVVRPTPPSLGRPYVCDPHGKRLSAIFFTIQEISKQPSFQEHLTLAAVPGASSNTLGQGRRTTMILENKDEADNLQGIFTEEMFEGVYGQNHPALAEMERISLIGGRVQVTPDSSESSNVTEPSPLSVTERTISRQNAEHIGKTLKRHSAAEVELARLQRYREQLALTERASARAGSISWFKLRLSKYP